MELIPKTQLDKDIDGVLENADTITLAASATARTLRNAHEAFWGMPDDRLVAVLNRIGPEKVQAMFDQHFALAVATNAFLDAMEFGGTRAITERGREITLGEGVFALAPVAEPE